MQYLQYNISKRLIYNYHMYDLRTKLICELNELNVNYTLII